MRNKFPAPVLWARVRAYVTCVCVRVRGRARGAGDAESRAPRIPRSSSRPAFLSPSMFEVLSRRPNPFPPLWLCQKGGMGTPERAVSFQPPLTPSLGFTAFGTGPREWPGIISGVNSTSIAR